MVNTVSLSIERRQYISQNPLDIVGVHCTHGFNRTGFLISAFMIEEHDWSVDAAVQEFRSAREPGIYKGDYLRDIYVRSADHPSRCIVIPFNCYDLIVDMV